MNAKKALSLLLATAVAFSVAVCPCLAAAAAPEAAPAHHHSHHQDDQDAASGLHGGADEKDDSCADRCAINDLHARAGELYLLSMQYSELQPAQPAAVAIFASQPRLSDGIRYTATRRSTPFQNPVSRRDRLLN